ncbi:hypothetical protein, partial [Streptomyces olivaceoviridis]
MGLADNRGAKGSPDAKGSPGTTPEGSPVPEGSGEAGTSGTRGTWGSKGLPMGGVGLERFESGAVVVMVLKMVRNWWSFCSVPLQSPERVPVA